MAESFYGGQPGISFVIVAYYETIDEMVENFKKGPSYEAVHFDEHVLINPSNKNNADNGKIYRRGYDYTNSMGGAVYIGCIAGPPGESPEVRLTSIEDIINKYNASDKSYDLYQGTYTPSELAPGKESSGQYNDGIEWAYCTIFDSNSNRTVAYIGFKWTYLVVDCEASSVNPYYNRDNQTDNFTNTDLLTRTDDGSHPFWEQWHINVPKGIKGDALENFRIITASANDGVESYTGQDDDRRNGREILVYDYYHFDKEEGGEPVTIYLGDYNMITGITVAEDGSLTINYTHDDNTILDKTIQWIDSITLDTNGTLTVHFNTGNETTWKNILKWVASVELTETGHFTIEFNNGDNSYETDLVWVKEVSFDETGEVTVIYNNGETTTYSNLKWITSISLDENGSFHIGFNNGDEYNTNLVWVKEVLFDTSGSVTVVYNNGKTTSYSDLKWISELSLDEDGLFHIGFNTGDEYNTNIVWVKEIAFDTSGSVTVIYNNGETTTYSNLKWITAISLDENGLFHIDFNNGDEYNTNIVWVKEVLFDTSGSVNVIYNNGETTTYSNLKWISELSLDENGLFHIGFNNGDEYDTNIIWVKEVAFDTSGSVNVVYNNGETTTYSNLKWISELSLDENGLFHIGFNNGDEYNTNIIWVKDLASDDSGTITITYNDGTSQILNSTLKWPVDVSINIGDEEGTGNQKVHIEYNTGEEEDIGEPLNYIMQMEMVESNYHLLVWYSDPAKRQEIINEGKSYYFDNKDGWLDLGSVKDESGILIGTNYSYVLPDDVTQEVISEIANLLDTTYPNGLEGINLQGKVITVGDNSTDNKLFYAYNYDTDSWYYIGQLAGGGGSADPENVVLFDIDPQTKTDELYEGGAWFVLEDYSKYG